MYNYTDYSGSAYQTAAANDPNLCQKVPITCCQRNKAVPNQNWTAPVPLDRPNCCAKTNTGATGINNKVCGEILFSEYLL